MFRRHFRQLENYGNYATQYTRLVKSSMPHVLQMLAVSGIILISPCILLMYANHDSICLVFPKC